MSAGWGFSEGNSTSTTFGWGFESDSPGITAASTYSGLEVQVVNARNRARRVMTTMPEFTTYLAQAGLEGPYNIVLPGLDKSPWARKIGAGAQFTVFLDTRRPAQDRVIKRVNVFDTYSNQQQKREEDANFRRQLYTIETEILALCHPPLRRHRNIVTLFAWGYDYRVDSSSPSVPILYMERAQFSLSSFLASKSVIRDSSVPQDTLRYQLCLDIAEGLAAMHTCGIVHGDIKPDNILIFPQSNPKVPYIAKLSDFGVCVALQDESVPANFAVYRGTPGWRPPEAIKYVEEIHGTFSPELLLRSDSFSYGLLVLSVFVTGGRSPLPESLESSGQASYSFVSNAISMLSPPAATPMSSSPLDDSLEVLNNATDLRGTLRAQIRSLLLRVLQLKPEKRDLVSSEMLADEADAGYVDWRYQKDNKSEAPIKTLIKGFSWQRGIQYWLNLGQKQLRELDDQYDSFLKQGEEPRFSGETLHGMAIAHLSSVLRQPTYREQIERALIYVTASALAGFYVAQGICERLQRGLGRSLPESIDEATRLQWLYNAASTGSLLAWETLAKSNRDLYTSARSEFRKNGGYNDAYTRTIQTQAKLLEKSYLLDIIGKQDVNSYVIDVKGNRLLHLASMVGNVEAIESLLSLENIEVNIRNDTGETPLLLACKAAHAEIVKLLVSSGADASIVSGDTFSVGPLHWLFNFETEEIPDIGRILVQKANAPINHRTTPAQIKKLHGGGYEYPYGQIQTWHFPYEWPYGTALHWATFSRSYAAVDTLCEMGTDIDALDLESSDFALTALSMAANRIDADMVQYLLKKGASHKKTDMKNRNPLHFLSEDMSSWSRGFLGWRGLRDWVLCGTSVEHRLSVDRIVKLLLEAGCDLEGEANSGREFPLTPLAYATGRKIVMDANVTLSLVKSGAKIDVPVPTGSSLLQEWAVVNPDSLTYPNIYTTVLTTLIHESGVEVLTHRDPLGYTFLAGIMGNGWLSFQDVYQVVEYYRASGGPSDGLNSRDKNGYTPLHSALGRYQSKFKQAPLIDLVEALYSWGADLTTVSNANMNALHILGQNDWLDDLPALDCLQFFKAHLPECDFVKIIGQQDDDGQTPLMFMAKTAKAECVKWLVEEGVSTEAVCTGWSQQGWTAMDLTLHEAERYRRWFLVDIHAYEALRGGVHNYTLKAQSRSDDLKEKFPKVFQYLLSKGAKRGGELGFETGGHNEPVGFDKYALGENKIDVQTPEEWKFVYLLESRPPKKPQNFVRYVLGKAFGK